MEDLMGIVIGAGSRFAPESDAHEPHRDSQDRAEVVHRLL
jgi:hypothetical protein